MNTVPFLFAKQVLSYCCSDDAQKLQHINSSFYSTLATEFLANRYDIRVNALSVAYYTDEAVGDQVPDDSLQLCNPAQKPSYLDIFEVTAHSFAFYPVRVQKQFASWADLYERGRFARRRRLTVRHPQFMTRVGEHRVPRYPIADFTRFFTDLVIVDCADHLGSFIDEVVTSNSLKTLRITPTMIQETCCFARKRAILVDLFWQPQFSELKILSCCQCDDSNQHFRELKEDRSEHDSVSKKTFLLKTKNSKNLIYSWST